MKFEMKRIVLAILRELTPPLLSRLARKALSRDYSFWNRLAKCSAEDLAGKYLYYGNLYPHEPQFSSEKWRALALVPKYAKDICLNVSERIPCPDSSIEKIQSQDVFEHIELSQLPFILGEIYRVLAIGGVFRLSLPDYNSPPLRSRCVFDENGQILADISCGGSVIYDLSILGRRSVFRTDGWAHLWFPTYDIVKALVENSALTNCSKITYYHYFKDKDNFVCEPIPENEMYVSRIPPNDMRAEGKPISIVVDFIK
jgi:hypothetical protein